MSVGLSVCVQGIARGVHVPIRAHCHGVCWRTLRTGICEQLMLAVRLQQAGG